VARLVESLVLARPASAREESARLAAEARARRDIPA